MNITDRKGDGFVRNTIPCIIYNFGLDLNTAVDLTSRLAIVWGFAVIIRFVGSVH